MKQIDKQNVHVVFDIMVHHFLKDIRVFISVTLQFFTNKRQTIKYQETVKEDYYARHILPVQYLQKL